MSHDKSKTNSLPSYKVPPVIEVVCGINFKSIEQFKAPHFGLFWQKVRDEFPTLKHATPLGFPPKTTDLILDPEFFFSFTKTLVYQRKRKRTHTITEQ